MKNTLLSALLGYLILFLCGCANVVSPQGGPRDYIAPQVIEAYPPNQAVNIRPERITLKFNELVGLNDFNQEIQINPYLDPKQLKASAKGKTIQIDFNQALQPLTTYHINFGKSITDLTEKNPLSYEYTFSTGPKLDTLEITGTALSNLDHQPLAHATVGLYPLTDTLDVSTQKAQYYTQTNTQGTFKFQNLNNQAFKLIAFQDLNKNLRPDALTEVIGFVKEPIRATVPKHHQLYLFREDTRTFTLKRPLNMGHVVDLPFSKGLSSYTLRTPSVHHYINTSNTLRIYPSGPLSELSLVAFDSSGTKIDTTLQLPAPSLLAPAQNIALIPKTMYQGNPPFKGIELTSQYLIKQINTEHIALLSKGDTLPYSSSTRPYTISPDRLKLSFPSDDQIDTLTLLLKAGSILFETGQTNIPLQALYHPINPESFGSLSGSVNTQQPHYIMSLTGPQETIHTHHALSTSFSYTHLSPGTYTLKILIDTNANGRYDSGNLEHNELPETYYIYPQPIVVKANWEQGNINITLE